MCGFVSGRNLCLFRLQFMFGWRKETSNWSKSMFRSIFGFFPPPSLTPSTIAAFVNGMVRVHWEGAVPRVHLQTAACRFVESSIFPDQFSADWRMDWSEKSYRAQKFRYVPGSPSDLNKGNRKQRAQQAAQAGADHSRIFLTKFRVRTGGPQGNQRHYSNAWWQ